MATFGEIGVRGVGARNRNRAYSRQWRKDHPLTEEQKLKRAEDCRRWREAHPGYDQKRWLKMKRGMTAVQRDKRAEYNRRYHAEHLGDSRWHEENPGSNRESAWIQMGVESGWSYDMFLAMFESQKGRCLGCGCMVVKTRKEVKRGVRLAHLDHDHVSGRVRGILCAHCNQALGSAMDDASTLRRLADYVESFREVRCDV